jgi:hypothetical protein
VYLVEGDRATAEPAARRLAEALAQRAGCALEAHVRPPRLSPILGDLRTYALFSSAKVLLVVETGALADRAAAAAFIDEAADAVPLSSSGGGEDAGSLSPGERRAALSLLQAVRLFEIDPLEGEPAELLGRLPDWVFQGARKGGRKRTKKRVAALREDLADLLTAARAAGLHGFGEHEISELAAVVREGLPPGHTMVLAESSVAADHPVVGAIEERGARLRLARVESERRGWSGVEELVDELARQTGVRAAPAAVAELARRTLRKEGGGRGKSTESATTDRFAAEYRKLAELARGSSEGGEPVIERAMVEEAVEDRGEEDVFKILDAVGEGRGGEALERLDRYLGAAGDALAARLSFFALFAGFCRNLTAVRGMMAVAGVRAGERNYGRFKSGLAPRLQGELAGRKSPLAGLHPYPLHRAYLTVPRMSGEFLARLPWRVLETELALKGESAEPETALAELVVEVASAVR